MDNENNYHWGATAEIMDIIHNRDISPETNRLAERRIYLVQPGKMRVKRDTYGNQFWTPRRPDANSRREVVEIDLKLVNRRRRRMGIDITQRPEQPEQGSSRQFTPQRVRASTESDNESAVIQQQTGTTYPVIDTRKFGEEEAKIVQYLQINKIIEEPKRKTKVQRRYIGFAKEKTYIEQRNRNTV